MFSGPTVPWTCPTCRAYDNGTAQRDRVEVNGKRCIRCKACGGFKVMGGGYFPPGSDLDPAYRDSLAQLQQRYTADNGEWSPEQRMYMEFLRWTLRRDSSDRTVSS